MANLKKKQKKFHVWVLKLVEKYLTYNLVLKMIEFQMSIENLEY